MGCSTSLAMSAVKTENYEGEAVIFTDQQKKIIHKTWKFLADDLNGRGTRIFLRIFELHPYVKELFPCRDLEGEDLLRDANFKGHASRFMQAVGAAVDNIDNLDGALAPLLIGLGKQHIHFRGFKPDYWDAFREAILFVWEMDLGDKFNEQTRDAWVAVFGFIMVKLKEGYKKAKDERARLERGLGDGGVSYK